MANSSEQKPLIEKKIIHAGTKTVPFENGTKVTFHFQTRLGNEEGTLLDDSRKMGIEPMVLVLGKKFKLEVWEAIVQQMALNEVAEFTVDKSLVLQYPFISKVLRNSANPNKVPQKTHCCVATLQNEGVGFNDLNELLRAPVNLKFTIELLKVEQPADYTKEIWQMSDEEKLEAIPVLKERGNLEYKNSKFEKAAETYAQAIGMLEQLMTKEKPHDKEWDELDKTKIPILLNYCQCKLLEKEYYSVIEHCTTVLKSEPDNVKALFRRGRAHLGAWNPEEAKEDFRKVLTLDPSLTNVVQKELQKLEECIKQRNEQDKAKLQKLFS